MKNKFNFLPFLIILSVLMFSTSCKKEGCTDSTATNYDADADNDDGSCTYPAIIDNGGIVSEGVSATVNGSALNPTYYNAYEQSGYYVITASNTNTNSGITLYMSANTSSGSLGMSSSYSDNGNSETASSGSYNYTVSNNVISGTFSFETASHIITNGSFTIEL